MKSRSAFLTEVDRSAVLPPPLCRDCRWCRPEWSGAVPPFFLIPHFWRMFWTAAICRHPTSRSRSSPDPVAGYRGRVSYGSCRSERSWTGSPERPRCGPPGRYFAARGYPAWRVRVLALAGVTLIVALYLATIFGGAYSLVTLFAR